MNQQKTRAGRPAQATPARRRSPVKERKPEPETPDEPIDIPALLAREPGPAQQKLLIAAIRQYGRAIGSSNPLNSWYLVSEPALLRGLYDVSSQRNPVLLPATITSITGVTHERPKRLRATLHMLDARGMEEELAYDSADEQAFIDGYRASHLPSIIATPTRLKVVTAALRDIILQLSRDNPGLTSTLDCIPHLGWYRQNGAWVWLHSNGIETEAGFLPADESHIAGTRDKPAHEFTGAAVDGPPDYPAIHRFLTRYLPGTAGEMILAALIGAAVRAMLPRPSWEDETLPAGLTPLSLVLHGSAGVGKSKGLTVIQQLFTARGNFDKQADIADSGIDTALGRLHRGSVLHSILLVAPDVKSEPSNPEFDKEYRILRDIVNVWGNGGDAGVVSSRQQTAVERKAPSGLPVFTANHDLKNIMLARGDGGILDRCILLQWPENGTQPADMAVALETIRNRQAFYALGQRLRGWILAHLNAGTWDSAYRQIEEQTERALDYAGWCVSERAGRQRFLTGHCVLGLVTLCCFLEDASPETTLQAHIAGQIEPFISDRLREARATTETIDRLEHDVTRVVLEALEIAHTHYPLKTQHNQPLTEKHIPDGYGAAFFGVGIKPDRKRLDTLGYLLSTQEAMGYHPAVAYGAIADYARDRHIDLPPREQLARQLEEQGIIRPGIYNGKSGPVSRVNILESKARRTSIPVWVIPLSCFAVSASDEDAIPCPEPEAGPPADSETAPEDEPGDGGAGNDIEAVLSTLGLDTSQIPDRR